MGTSIGMNDLKITRCPVCGSNQIKQVERDWVGKFQGQSYIVPMLKFYECTNCGEKLYNRHAMQKIEAYSPAFAKRGIKAKVDRIGEVHLPTMP